MDEVSYLELSLYQMLLPMLGVDGSWMFLASSPPKDPSHWFTQLREKKSEIYRDIPIERVCKDCQYKYNMDEWTKCTHQTIRMGTNKDAGKRKRLDVLSIDEDANLREDYGLTIQEDSSSFSREDVDALLSLKQRCFSLDGMEWLQVNFDPNYGGSNNYGVSVTTPIGKDDVICWLDFQDPKREFIEFQLEQLKSISDYIRGDNYDISMVITIESNSRPDGDNLRYALRREVMDHPCYQNMHVLIDEKHDNCQGRAGYTLDKPRKDEIIKHAQIILKRGLIRMWDKVGTNHPKGIKGVLGELKAEMLRFKYFEYGESKKMHGSKKRKSGAKQGTLYNDDMIISLISNLWWRNRMFAQIYGPQRKSWRFKD